MTKIIRLALGICCSYALAAGAALTVPDQTQTLQPQVPQAIILSITGNRYPGLARALATVGFQVGVSAAYPLASGRPQLLIVPGEEGKQLSPSVAGDILNDVKQGLPLLLDGPSPLAQALGIQPTGSRQALTSYHWEHYANDLIRLPGRLVCPQFTVAPHLEILAHGALRQSPLVVSGSFGQGRFLFSAIPLEPQQGMVFQYLPFLAQAIVDELRVSPSLAANNLCVYLDLGGEPKTDPDLIAAQLQQWSVREVHLGAFYGSDTFKAYVPRFLAAAHRHGIAVYAWLEYPMVSKDFWNQHPEWREVTANGHPAVMDWRDHMALEDPRCFAAVAELTRQLVLDYDWDGVDFAELYFEAETEIFQKPGDFTPMHPFFRKMFQQRYGVDPRQMFDHDSPFYGPKNPKLRDEMKAIRVELVTELTEKFLAILASCKTQKPYLQTTLTFIDTLRDPAVTERFGVDADRLLELEHKFGFNVEIEDPYTVWNSGPDRYRAMGEYYRPRLPPGTPLTLDVNVVDREPPGRPLNKPRGLELYALVANVAAHVDFITLYAYATFSADDMRLVPFVLGAQQIAQDSTKGGALTARREMIWDTDTRGRSVYMDGREWPCYSATQVLIPPGTHQVATDPLDGGAPQDPLRVEGINGTIVDAAQSGGRVTLTYESRGRCYVTLNRRPAAVLCDGAEGVGQILTNGEGACLELPQGKHQVEMQ